MDKYHLRIIQNNQCCQLVFSEMQHSFPSSQSCMSDDFLTDRRELTMKNFATLHEQFTKFNVNSLPSHCQKSYYVDDLEIMKYNDFADSLYTIPLSLKTRKSTFQQISIAETLEN